MIIDTHSHLAYSKIYPAKYLADMFLGLAENEKAKLERILPIFLKDKEASYFLKQMDKNEIDKSFLLIIDGGIGMGEPALALEDIFKLHYSILKAHPDRFAVFAGVDPRRGKKGFELFKRGIFDYGFKGLKLYPPMGYAINDERLFPYYDICSLYDLPVIIHTGPSLDYLHNHFSNPLLITDIADKYQSVKFVLAHAANKLTSQLLEILSSYQNVYFDLAGLTSRYNDVAALKKNCHIIFDKNTSKKIFWGLDWPLFNLFRPIKEDIEYVKHLFVDTNNHDKEPLHNIFYKNALRVFKS